MPAILAGGRPRALRRRVGAVVLAATVTAAWSSLQAAEKRVPIQRDDVVGAWIGLTTDDLELIRLDLAAEGGGALGFIFVDLAPCVVPLKSWSFSRGRIELEVADTPTCARGRRFQALVAGNTLELDVLGEGWRRQAHLKRESPLEDRWEQLKTAMGQLVGQPQ